MHDKRDGRSFHIAKAGMSDHFKGLMQKVQKFDGGGTVDASPSEPDPKAAQQMQNGATSGGTSAGQAWSNLKTGLGFDEGGKVPAASPAAPVDNGDIHPIDSAVAALSSGGSQSAYDQSMASLPTAPDPGQYDSGPGPATGPALASTGPVTPDQVAGMAGAPHVAAPVPGDGAPPDSGDPMADFAKLKGTGLDQLSTDLHNAQKQEMAANSGIANTEKNYASDLSKMAKPEDIIAKLKAGDDQAKEAFMNSKIDPNHYWASKSTGAKISAAIGMMFGGIGAGLTHGPNLAVEAVNKAIERDMEAQRSDQSQAMNLWKMNREATQNDLQANLLTRNQMLTAVEAKTRMFQAQAGNAQTEMKFAPLYQSIEQQKLENRVRMGLSSGGQSEMDPARLVPMLVKNPEQQKQVYEEIGRAQNVANNKEKIMSAFDSAAKDNTVLRTGAGYLRTPGSVMALHQLMLPNFKQIDGTVRQAAMDESFHNVTPSPGDSDGKNAIRRQALMDWMNSETAAPVAKGNGLDLSKFRSTNSDSPAGPRVTERVTGDGKIALFDSNTKKFMGYK